MSSVPVPENESARLQLLYELDLLDTQADPLFDRITGLVKELLDADVAVISLIDKERQWFKAKVGFDVAETPREESFCTHVVASGDTMHIDNALEDVRFSSNPHVASEGGIRSYAGAPITLFDDHHLGTLCVISQHPNKFSNTQLRYLETLAHWLSETIADRYAIDNYQAEREVLAHGPVCAVVWRVEPHVHLSYVAENAARVLGYSSDYLLREDTHFESIVHPDERDELLQRMQNVLDGKQEVLEMDYRVIQPGQGDADAQWIQHYARADRDSAGNIVRVRGYLLNDSKGKRMEMALREANQNFELALAAGEFFTWSWDMLADELHVSHPWSLIAGYSADEEQQLNWREVIPAEDLSYVQQRMREHATGHTKRFDVRFRVKHKHGHYVWLHSVGRIIARDGMGQATKIAGVHHDISRQVADEKLLAQQTELLELVSHVQHSFMLSKSFTEVCDHALPKLMAMTASHVGFVGELPAQSQHRNLLRVHGIRLGTAQHESESVKRLGQQRLEVEAKGQLLQSVLTAGEPKFHHQRLKPEDLSLAPLTLPPLNNALIMPLYFRREVVGLMILANADGGFSQRYLGLLRPMLDTFGTLMHMRRMDEERQQAVETLRKLATTDELTGLANRRVFWEAAQQRFDEFMRYQVPMTIAIIDLDHFKQVNDTFGHGAGDDVLREFCRRTQAQLRDMDLFGRLGGEEFAILFAHTAVDDAIQALERVRKAIAAEPVSVEGEEIAVTISAGMAQLRQSDNKLDQWMARADEALYQAKEQGRNQCVAVSENESGYTKLN